MTKIDVLNREGQKTGEIELSDAIFMSQINVPIMHQAVRVYLASLRRGTHSTKNRSMVRGGGKKPWRQKGTGRASFGSSRNPVWRGGGVSMGPSPHDHDITITKKMRRAALFSAISSKLAEGDLIVIDELTFDAPKTKEMMRVLANLNATNALVVLPELADAAILSARNIQGVETVDYTGLNTYNVLYHDKLVLTKEALASFEEVYA